MTGQKAPDHELSRRQRSLLPAMLGVDPADRETAGGELPRSARDWLVDVVMFTVAVAAGLLALATGHHDVGSARFVLNVGLGALACLALWVRRRHPFAVGMALIGASAFSQAAGLAGVAGLFTVAVYCVPRRALQAALLWLGASLVLPLVYAHHGHYAVITGLVRIGLGVLAVWFGSFVRVRRQLVLSLHGRARRLHEEQHVRVVEARRAERARMAREMHDVLAHRISLLSLHAGALEFRPDAPADEIARAASVIRVSARAAQEELREVIGLLRADSEADGVEPPQPTVADLSMLVAESRRAGMEVRLEAELPDAALPPILGRTVYRVVQEGLTNAHRHAPGQTVVVTLGGDHRAGVHVEVVNRPAVGGTGWAGAAPDQVGSGSGLIGLGERLALVGGRLGHARLPGGGFSLRATLPWPAGPSEHGVPGRDGPAAATPRTEA